MLVDRFCRAPIMGLPTHHTTRRNPLSKVTPRCPRLASRPDSSNQAFLQERETNCCFDSVHRDPGNGLQLSPAADVASSNCRAQHWHSPSSLFRVHPIKCRPRLGSLAIAMPRCQTRPPLATRPCAVTPRALPLFSPALARLAFLPPPRHCRPHRRACRG